MSNRGNAAPFLNSAPFLSARNPPMASSQFGAESGAYFLRSNALPQPSLPGMPTPVTYVPVPPAPIGPSRSVCGYK